MGKATKQTKKFQKRHLKRAIDDRKTFQKKKAVIDKAKKTREVRSAKAKRDGTNKLRDDDEEGSDDDDSADDAEEDDEDDAGEGPSRLNGMSVEDFLGGGFKAGMDSDASEDEDDDEDDDDDALSDLDDLSDGEMHAQDLDKLKEKDPEFYKYLQEHDKDLLQFGASDSEASDDESDDASSEAAPVSAKGKGKAVPQDEAEEASQHVVTLKTLRGWQKAMIQHRSLKALRKLLLAFRSAAHMDDVDDGSRPAYAFVVEEADVYNKLILTVLKYTPVVLQHHIPYKETAQGKFKLPTNNKKFALLQRPIQTYFSNLHHLLGTLSEQKMVSVAVTESARMVPYLINNRRMAREYIKVMLELWSTASDQTRIAAFLAIRKTARAGDEAMLDLCLRGTYQSFVRSTKLTTLHTLPSINLMKNSASELYALDSAASYQQAFSFIRQLAIHLRNALKTRSAESFQSVYNWQYIHCVDFWSIVLSTACDQERKDRGANELQQLIYPLTQVASGAMRLIPTSRYFPLRMHLLRSLLRLMQRTGVFIPLASTLLEMLSAPEFTRKAKGSTLKPLDFTTTLRAPAAYVRTRVYADQLAEEVTHLLLEFVATQSRSIALPELVLPLTAQLKRTLKHTTSPKLSAAAKQLLSKMDSTVKLVESKRRGVEFAPNDTRAVHNFLSRESGEYANETPLEGAFRLAKKVRDQKRKIVETQEQSV
ncbi:unnamed protein product [Parajaminaea phylloscopi]